VKRTPETLDVYFESSTLVFNNSDLDLTLIAFKPGYDLRPIIYDSIVLSG